MREISELLWQTATKAGATFTHVCGVPYTALPLATCITLDHNVPMVIKRREAKDYGTKQMIEGVFEEGDHCLIIEDIVTSGGSVLETAQQLNEVKLKVTDAIVLINRCQGGAEKLQSESISLHSVFDINEVLDVLLRNELIDNIMFEKVQQFIADNQFRPTPPAEQKPVNLSTYRERAELTSNSLAKKLFNIMEDKQTNLSFSADVTSSEELLRLADLVGPHICMLKTHVDILEDFSQDFVAKLTQLSSKHNFVVFEDRKFADIGNTVKHQYAHGMYRIADWAQLINCHAVPGDGILAGLREAAVESGKPDRACVMIAQMSSAGNLCATGDYAKQTVAMATANSDFVVGFICVEKVSADERFLHMTPGVSMSSAGDKLGQQYLTPEEVIGSRKSDIMIVGRGIYKAEDPVEAAIAYKQAGFEAYKNRCT